MSNKERLLQLLILHEGQWFSHSRLADRTRLSHQSIFQICRQLAEEGRIRRERSGREWWVCYGEPRRPIPVETDLSVITFNWIADTRLRDVVRADWEEASKSVKCGAWKAGVILTGACLEGVLVAALQKREAEVRKLLPEEYKGHPIAGLPLRQLVRLAERFGIVGTRAADFLIRSRNLIHPGVAAAEPGPIGKGDARAALELLEACIRRMAPSQQQPPN